jgi:DNA-binding MarR family transcriptional regulator
MLLSLTRAGKQIVRSRHAERVKKLSRLVDQLTPEERAVLADSVHVLTRLTEIAADPT